MNYYDSEGNITSPGYPSDYGTRLNCYSHLKIEDAEEITLIFEMFDTEEAKDSLVFGAGPDIYELDPNLPNVYELDGSLTGLPLINRTYTFNTNQIFFYFNSDKNNQAMGYFLSYTSDIDSCISETCLNDGTCVDEYYDYTCNCVPGYTGRNCEIQINECDSMPCLNGGSCMDLLNGHFCECLMGFNGDFCENNIDECAPAPCQNGGTCTDGVNGYSCACAPGYTGGDCQTDINECMSSPCQNGGTCNNEIAMYSCTCAPGFEGDQCGSNIDECLSLPCENRGTCMDGVNGYTCECPADASGVNCEISLNACMSQPCQNGSTCVNSGADFICQCPSGFDGTLCENDINECSSLPCLNGATCLDQIAMFTCQCRFGYSGTYCQDFILCDLEGDWYNECNDKLTIIQTATGMLLGDYSTNVELLTGMAAPTIVLGYASQDSPVPTLGFTVIRNNGASTTSWTGQCQICDRQEVLYTTWINTEAVTTCPEIKQATKIGQDKWTRYMQSQAPREDLP